MDSSKVTVRGGGTGQVDMVYLVPGDLKPKQEGIWLQTDV